MTISYPDPDSKGRARIYYQKQDFYFGKHGTKESRELFDAWKKVLGKTGKAPKTSLIRDQLSQLRTREQVIRGRLLAASVVFIVTSLSIAIIIGTWSKSAEKLSKKEVQTVDTFTAGDLASFRRQRLSAERAKMRGESLKMENIHQAMREFDSEFREKGTNPRIAHYRVIHRAWQIQLRK